MRPAAPHPYTIRWKDGDTEHGTLTVAPATLDIEAELWPEQRHLGIYQAVVYRSEVALQGTFPAVDGLLDPQATYDWHRAYLSLRLGDLRGLRDDVRLALDGDTLTAEAGNGLIYLYEISTQPLVMQLGGADPDMRGRETAFECRLTLNGSEEINFVPVGRTTHATVAGQWDAPGFGGRLQPPTTSCATAASPPRGACCTSTATSPTRGRRATSPPSTRAPWA